MKWTLTKFHQFLWKSTEIDGTSWISMDINARCTLFLCYSVVVALMTPLSLLIPSIRLLLTILTLHKVSLTNTSVPSGKDFCIYTVACSINLERTNQLDAG